MVKLPHAGITQYGIRVVLPDGREAIWDNDGTAADVLLHLDLLSIRKLRMRINLLLQHAQIISYEEYSPYGSTTYQAVNGALKPAAKRYRFTSKERDDESGLSYHSARYYAPWLGRWVSCDPGGMADGANLYVYARNRPLILIDVNGADADAPNADTEFQTKTSMSSELCVDMKTFSLK